MLAERVAQVARVVPRERQVAAGAEAVGEGEEEAKGSLGVGQVPQMFPRVRRSSLGIVRF